MSVPTDASYDGVISPRITRLTVQRQLTPHQQQQQQQYRAQADNASVAPADSASAMSASGSRQRPGAASAQPAAASSSTASASAPDASLFMLPSQNLYKLGPYSIDKQTLRLGINIAFVLGITLFLVLRGSSYVHIQPHLAHPEYDSLNQLKANTHMVLVNHDIRHAKEEDHEIPVGYFQYVTQHAVPEVQQKVAELRASQSSQDQEEAQHIETFMQGWISGLAERYNVQHYEQIDGMIASIPTEGAESAGVEQMVHRGILQCQTKQCQQLHQHILQAFPDNAYVQQHYKQPSAHTTALPTNTAGVYEWLGHYFATGNDRYLLPLIEIAHTNSHDTFHQETLHLLQSYAEQPSHTNIRDLLQLHDENSGRTKVNHEEL